MSLLLKYSAYHTVGVIILGVAFVGLQVLGLISEGSFPEYSNSAERMLVLVVVAVLAPVMVIWLTMLRDAIRSRKWIWSFFLVSASYLAGVLYYFNVYSQKNT